MTLQKKFNISIIPLLLAMVCAAAPGQPENFTRATAPDNKSGRLPNGRLVQLLPSEYASPIAGDTVEFSWTGPETAAQYRLEIEDVRGKSVLAMTIPSHIKSHRMPWSHLYCSDDVRWRVVARDRMGNTIAQTAWRVLLAPSSQCEI